MARSKLIILIALVLLMAVPAAQVRAQEVTAISAGPAGTGTAVISDANALSDAITFSLTGVTPPEDGTVYEGWVVTDDGSIKTSTGILEVLGGAIEHEFISPSGENLIHNYDKAVITVEPVPDDDPGPSAVVAFSDQIPGPAMAHIRHLLTNWPAGADEGILTNLKTQLDTAIQHANLALNSTSLDDVFAHTHHVINIIEGTDGPNYDASFGDPGDGLGVLAHAADRKHAGFAAGAADDDAVIGTHGQLVNQYGKNAADWATLARDTALSDVLTQSNAALAKLFLGPGAGTVLGQLETARNGFGADGGAEQAYTEAQLMATYSFGVVEVTIEVPTIANGAVISDAFALSDRINISMDSVTAPEDGTVYEGWVVSDDGAIKTSIGILEVSGGAIEHEFISPTGENLVHNYDKVVITVEPVPDDDPGPSAVVLASDQIPGPAMAHIRHLLTNWPAGADEGILTNLKTQLDTAIQHANLALNSTSLDDVFAHTHHVINIIEGTDGPNYDASFGDPGDGLGVLAHAADRKHAGFAAGAADDDAVIGTHGQLVNQYGKNAADWATLARDTALSDVLTQSNAALAKLFVGPGVGTILGYLETARNGFGADGGAEQAYTEAQLMATYVLEERPTGSPDIAPPSVGDTAVPMLAQMALIASLAFLGAGGLLFMRSRRSRVRS